MVILLGLIFVGSLQESRVEQLIEGAGPDSSAFVDESSTSTIPPKEETEFIPEREKPVVEKPVAAVVETVKDSVAKPAAPVEVSSEPKKIQDSGNEKIYFYKIRKGDTMYKIAAKFGNKPDDVLSMNGLTDMGLQADKEIKVKIKGLHSVQDGEGINAIAEKYSVPAKSIKVANGLSSDVLSAGAELIIPLK